MQACARRIFVREKNVGSSIGYVSFSPAAPARLRILRIEIHQAAFLDRPVERALRMRGDVGACREDGRFRLRLLLHQGHAPVVQHEQDRPEYAEDNRSYRNINEPLAHSASCAFPVNLALLRLPRHADSIGGHRHFDWTSAH
jgi:hypothetical protein